MVKSMFAAVAGLRAHQSKMDIIGNNIANVNTWGYKAGSMSFKDAMYQTTSGASGGVTTAGGYGGKNASQIGYGVTVGSVSYDFSMGGIAPSARNLDCMIDGSGFFLVGPMAPNDGLITLDDDDAVKNSGLYLSRVGKFEVDENDYLVDDAGNYVYGFVNNGDLSGKDGTFDTTSLQPLKLPSADELGDVSNGNAKDQVAAALKALEEAKVLLDQMKTDLANAKSDFMGVSAEYEASKTRAGVAGFQTTYDTAKTDMDNAYKLWQEATTATDKITYKADYDSKRKLCEYAEFNLLKAKAELQAPTALAALDPNLIATYDTAYDDYIAASNAYAANPIPVNKTDLDAKKAVFDTAEKAFLDAKKSISAIEEGSVEFRLGKAKQAVDAATAKVTAAELTVTNAQKKYDTALKNETSTNVGNAGTTDKDITFQNYSVQTDGSLVATTNTGVTVVVGQIALVSVQNPGGLVKESGYYYNLSDNCGNASAYQAGGSAGLIRGNCLEQAKVDLANEMTEMITTQRGFQANSKIITVTDQMLEELVNLKR